MTNSFVGQVVPRDSARLKGYPAISIRRNHVSMTKFKDEHDPGFQRVFGELQRWAKEFCNANGKYPHMSIISSFHSATHRGGFLAVDGLLNPCCTTALLVQLSLDLSLGSQAD